MSNKLIPIKQSRLDELKSWSGTVYEEEAYQMADELRCLRAVVQLAEHKIEQHLQGQYPDGAALKAVLAAIRDPHSLTS